MDEDEVQWISLALGNRKGIQLQNLCTNYPSRNVLSLHSTPLPSPMSLLLSEKDMVGWY